MLGNHVRPGAGETYHNGFGKWLFFFFWFARGGWPLRCELSEFFGTNDTFMKKIH